jgi:hypothetical protein
MQLVEVPNSSVEDNARERRMRRKSAGPSELKSDKRKQKRISNEPYMCEDSALRKQADP